jgi:hypothetical protein
MPLSGGLWLEGFASPYLAEQDPTLLGMGGTLACGGLVTFMALAIGWLLLGIASLRGRVFPRSQRCCSSSVASWASAFCSSRGPVCSDVGARMDWLVPCKEPATVQTQQQQCSTTQPNRPAANGLSQRRGAALQVRHGCSRELARIRSALSTRLRPVHELLQRACREYDKGATCFADAAHGKGVVSTATARKMQ